MSLKFKTLALLSLCFVSLPSLGLAASLDKAILLNEHGLTTEQENATKSLETAKKWLKDIIEKASEHDSFYRDLAERRLKNLEPR